MNSPAPIDQVKQNAYMSRFGDSLDEGYVPLPVALFRRAPALGLDPIKIVVLCNLFASWREVDDHPYLSAATIAYRMSVSPRTIYRALADLEKQGLIEKIKGTKGNGTAADRVVTRYSLTGAVSKIGDACVRPSSAMAPAAVQGVYLGGQLQES